MDIADEGSLHQEMANEAALEAQRRRADAAKLAYSGTCYYCLSEVKSPLRFCDQDCRNDFDEEQRILKAQGRL